MAGARIYLGRIKRHRSVGDDMGNGLGEELFLTLKRNEIQPSVSERRIGLYLPLREW